MNYQTPIVNFLLEDLIYIPTGEYVPMYNRPYVVNSDYDKIQSISERLNDNKSAKVSPNMLSGLSNGIIQNSAVPINTDINTSWVSIRKFIFLLKVSYTEINGIKHMVYLQGYTEYDGITGTGAIDPQLTHIINNVIETYVYSFNTPFGTVSKEKLVKIYNVTTIGDMNELMFSQRPKDIFDNYSTITTAQIIGNVSSVVNNAYSYSPFDKRPVCSTVENIIPTEYLARVINAGMLVNKEKELFINSTTVEQDYGPDVKLLEPGLNDNMFIRALARYSGFASAVSKFSFSTLEQFDPSISARFKVFNITKDIASPHLQNTPGVGDFWHGQDPVTIKAYTLIESSVALAVKYGFNKLYFTASNVHSPLMASDIFITYFNSFLNLDEQDFNILLEMFKSNFIQEIFLDESQNGAIALHIEMYVDLLGTSKICISYAGYPANWYTIPTFANSSFSPVVTYDKNSLDSMAINLNTTIDTIMTNIQQPNKVFY